MSDLSEQLKESEERIQDLLLESEGSRRVSKEKEREHEENLGRIIMAIEDEYKDTIKMQQEQVSETSGWQFKREYPIPSFIEVFAWSACLYGQFSLDKTLTLQASVTVQSFPSHHS